MWALRLLPGHPQRRMEDLYHRDRPGLWPPPPGGAHCPHGLLCVGAHLQDSGKSGWRNSVPGGLADRCWLRPLPPGLGQ